MDRLQALWKARMRALVRQRKEKPLRPPVFAKVRWADDDHRSSTFRARRGHMQRHHW
ncbi:MAG TPA: hypothetical protein VF310_01450 [Vicinamibacteria bacterium]